ncbi:MAG: aldo/keto reductase [Anaeroplasma bactoclasticum]|nr:aldo/keto reductase [Anaeroplasma bactoclasticum]MCM1557570.1 aldo/keto reductase [Anaeroplasma bactoclasticum]
MEEMVLNNKIKMPSLGIGTYLISPEDTEKCVKEALKIGYRLVDTANAYGNEKAVGRAIKASGVKREDIFVSTKIWATEYLNENIVEETLARLGLDYIDLLFIHQPCEHYMNAYRMIEKAVKEGKVKAIGVSNCEGKYLDDILKNCEIKPQVMQVEAHPYYTQDELRKTLEKYDIKLMSWYPLGHGDKSLINEPVFAELGKKYRKTNVQIILRWHIDMGFCVIPGTSKIDHVKDNFNVLDFSLSKEDMEKIAKINKNKRYYIRTEEMLNQFANFIPQYEK